MALHLTDDAAIQLRDAISHIATLKDNEWRAVSNSDEAEMHKSLDAYREKAELYTNTLLNTIANMARLGGNVRSGPAEKRSRTTDFAFNQDTDSGMFVAHIFFPEEGATNFGTWSSHS